MAAAVRRSFPGGPGRARERSRAPARHRVAPPTLADLGRSRRAVRDDSGETLALLILWPALLVAVLVLLVHTFIVVNAQSEAEVAASAGLRAAWRSSANADFLSEFDPVADDYTGDPYIDPLLHTDPHPKVLEMARDAEDAAARAAATDGGWRWWTPGATEVRSDWCLEGDPDMRPGQGQPGWVRVTVSGDVYGPLAALWPDRLDRVYAAATGPAVLLSPEGAAPDRQVPVDLPVC